MVDFKKMVSSSVNTSSRQICILKDLLKKLEEAHNVFEITGKSVEFCIDCKKIVKDISSHEGHNIIFSDCDHDGIGEWINCLKYILSKINE
jgi:hypothetical protein